VDEIWVNIPYKYNRFPDAEVVVPDFSMCSKVRLNRCEDYGPGTMYMGPAHAENCDADLVVVVNDDTKYPTDLTRKLVQLYEEDKSCWCLSGFKVDEYMRNNGRVGRYNRECIDVTESYGGVILDMKWLRDMKDVFLDFYKLTYNDDIIISNLLAKMGYPQEEYL
jgi:GT2 family glycosyltransferase